MEDKINDILRAIDKIEKVGEKRVKEDLSENIGLKSSSIEEIIRFISIKRKKMRKIFLKNSNTKIYQR